MELKLLADRKISSLLKAQKTRPMRGELGIKELIKSVSKNIIIIDF